MQCGPLRHQVDAKAAADARPFKHSVHVRPTSFRPATPADDDLRLQFQSLYQDMVTDSRRNDLICADVLASVDEGRSPLVLTERREHLELLAAGLEDRVDHVIVLQGGTSVNATKTIANRLKTIPPEESRVLVSTGKYIGEGFDDPRLDTLFLTLPISWQGTLSCLLYTSPSPRDRQKSRMPSSA